MGGSITLPAVIRVRTSVAHRSWRKRRESKALTKRVFLGLRLTIALAIVSSASVLAGNELADAIAFFGFGVTANAVAIAMHRSAIGYEKSKRLADFAARDDGRCEAHYRLAILQTLLHGAGVQELPRSRMLRWLNEWGPAGVREDALDVLLDLRRDARARIESGEDFDKVADWLRWRQTVHAARLALGMIDTIARFFAVLRSLFC